MTRYFQYKSIQKFTCPGKQQDHYNRTTYTWRKLFGWGGGVGREVFVHENFELTLC